MKEPNENKISSDQTQEIHKSENQPKHVHDWLEVEKLIQEGLEIDH
ncbi:MAG: hypothetical protein KBD53_10230 [Candidatus Omnitrophica bacterium]|nr:hypothetical protein [Candidatus Omnitrophota bacterium]